MANAVKGEASLDVDGRRLTLAYDFDALCEVEEIAGMAFADVTEQLSGGKPPLKTVRAVLAGGLKRHHPDITLAEMGDLYLTHGAAVAAAINLAMSSAMGRPAATGRPGGAATDPPRAKRRPRGTSTRSSKAGAKPG